MNELEKQELEEMWTDTLVKIERSRVRRKMTIVFSSLAAAVVLLAVSLTLFLPNHIEEPTVQLLNSRDIILSDGTQVHLMEGSELIYPEKFDGDKREVTLIGEAYFSVSASKERPFYVKMDKGVIKVVGTKFLAKSHPDNPEIKVSLDEGVVELKIENQETIVMKESQVVSFDVTKENSLENFIIFKDRTLEEIMGTMNKIYGVGVSFERDDLKDVKLSCKIPRYDNINQFLSLVDIVCQLDVTLHNNVVTIKDKQE